MKNFCITLILYLPTITIYMQLLLKCTKLLIKFSNKQSHYNLGHTPQFSVNPVHSVYNGTEWASYFGRKIWEQIPCEIRNKKFIVGFNREIKKQKPTECPIVSLIIKISWWLILRIHLLEKTPPLNVLKRKASGFQNTT